MSTLCRCKVGLSIRIQVDNGWKTEIAVFEFKTSTSTRQMCEKQQKKSMRLHVAILSGLEARGLDLQRSYPIVAEGRGQVLDFYTLRRYEDGRSTAKGISLPSQVSQLKTFLYSNSVLTLLSFRYINAQGDIFLGGAACEDVIDLPTTKDELASFLSGPSAKLLWNYTKLLLEYQDGINEQLRKKRSASITDPESPLWQAEAQEDDEQSEARTPPQTPKLYSLGKVRQPLPVPLANGSQKTTATPTQAAQRCQPVITSSVVDAGNGEDIEE
ncbi:hypothetical protein K457DRAFT_127231 [Linnemannia elongata AG-77]|uniref:Uncharacterized protein n=1 Tax=Linnemannia elongata AG-77 TaxID=1314771 RepID=A0A197JUC1_9FUNG|nr:hypothetical protein K457DRAFT_127231 [Linnemannia elongata AG-77]